MSFLGKVVEQAAVQTVAGVVRKYAEVAFFQAKRGWEDRNVLLERARKRRDASKQTELEDAHEVTVDDALRELRENRKK